MTTGERWDEPTEADVRAGSKILGGSAVGVLAGAALAAAMAFDWYGTRSAVAVAAPLGAVLGAVVFGAIVAAADMVAESWSTK